MRSVSWPDEARHGESCRAMISRGVLGESRVIWFSHWTRTHHSEQSTVTVSMKVKLQRSSVKTHEKMAILSSTAELGDVK